MNRRQLLRNGLGLLAMASAIPAVATIEGAETYSRELYEEALASGETFLLDFSATW